jgi:HD-like signal output (HDOD) protein/CheY-like chemotaxis protein
MRPRILFVDDESNLLNGLKRMMRSKRSDWDMTFMDSPIEALDKMAAHPFDLVVSDMRMPRMDGAAFLGAISEKWPETIRIILSGYSKEEAVMRTINPAHQYLAKPCEATAVIEALDRALELRRYVASDQIRRLVGSITSLPTLPDAAAALIQALDDRDIAEDKIAELIAQDIAMTAMVLRLTNSAFFGVRNHVSDLLTAVSLLGIDTLRSLAIVNGAFNFTLGAGSLGQSIEQLRDRSLIIGMGAHAIARAEGMPLSISTSIRTAGAVSHVGSLLLRTQFPEEFQEAMRLKEDLNYNIVGAERAVFGAAHPEVGAYLLGLWGLNNDITEAIAYHHEPSLAGAPNNNLMIVFLHAAQALVGGGGTLPAESDQSRWPLLDEPFITMMGYGHRVDDWNRIIREVGISRSVSADQCEEAGVGNTHSLLSKEEVECLLSIEESE